MYEHIRSFGFWEIAEAGIGWFSLSESGLTMESTCCGLYFSPKVKFIQGMVVKLALV